MRDFKYYFGTNYNLLPMEGGGGEDFGCGTMKVTPPSVKALQYFHVSALLNLPENRVILQILHPLPRDKK